MVSHTHTQSTGVGREAQACIRSSLCRCAACKGLPHACACMCGMLEIYMLYRTCPSWRLHVAAVVRSKRTRVGARLVFTLEKRWQPVKWEVEEVRGVKGRVGVRLGGGGGGVQVMHLSFYFDDSLQVKDELTLPDGENSERWTFPLMVFFVSAFSTSFYNLSPMKHLLFIYFYIYLNVF